MCLTSFSVKPFLPNFGQAKNNGFIRLAIFLSDV